MQITLHAVVSVFGGEDEGCQLLVELVYLLAAGANDPSIFLHVAVRINK